jgi:8-oxo-(d)GTP phosphatase
MKKTAIKLLILAVILMTPDNEMLSADEPSGKGQGQVLMLRHALAPGTGDPANFKLEDCSTQRNLNETGRRQAVAVGERLRSEGYSTARVFTSQWCRCKETAELMQMGEVLELPALNSFYQRWEDKTQNLRALKDFLSKQPVDGPLIILVTHQVTITALTNVFPASGDGVLLQLDGQGGFEIGPRMVFSAMD